MIGAARAGSIQRCTDYLANLSDVNRTGNFLLGSTSTLLGGLGAIFTPLATVRALSGAAGIASGVRAEMNSTFFYNQAIGTISKAIDVRRTKFWEQMQNSLKAPYEEYTFVMAYADIEQYHSLCSISSAFAEINDALVRQQTRSPAPADRLDERTKEKKALAQPVKASADCIGGRPPFKIENRE